jgi:zinc transport system substrate-binding protein
LSLVIALSLVPGSVILGGCTAPDAAKLQVVTSTSLLTYIVERVGGERVEVVNIVPPAQHPGDFDASPSDIQRLADADLFLLHGWPGETFADRLIASADNSDLTTVTIDVEGNWMTPPVQSEATDKVVAALSQVDSRNGDDYRKTAAEYKDAVKAKEADIRARLAQTDLSGVNVIAAFWQAGFLKWTGLNVIDTYLDPDSLTPQVVKGLVDKGREANVTLVVDNLHSGKDAGAGIAEELGVVRVVLSNFPGGFENTETWEKAIDYNVELLMAAISR